MKIQINITINPDKDNPRLPREIAILMRLLQDKLEGFRKSTGTEFAIKTICEPAVDNATK